MLGLRRASWLGRIGGRGGARIGFWGAGGGWLDGVCGGAGGEGGVEGVLFNVVVA